jgi:hypothetical protein
MHVRTVQLYNGSPTVDSPDDIAVKRNRKYYVLQGSITKLHMNKLYTYTCSNYSSFYQRPIQVQYIVVYLIDTLLKSITVWFHTGYPCSSKLITLPEASFMNVQFC